MAFHKCRNEGCEVQIEVRNTAEGWRPFEESGNMHQCQYSEYAKKQRAYQQEQEKNHNDHGNELVQPLRPTENRYVKPPYVDNHDNELTVNVKEPGFSSNAELNRPVEHKTEYVVQDTTRAESPKQMYERYVDHTLVQPPKLKLKILTSTEAEGLSHLYNSFGESHNIRFSQYHPQGALYTIAVFFEEIPLKQ